MQINNNLNNYMNNENGSKHNHHITECMRESSVKKPDGTTGGAPTVQQHGELNQEISKLESLNLNAYIPVQIDDSRKKGGFLKDMWDSLGEESIEGKGRKDRKDRKDRKETMGNKVAAFIQLIPQYIVSKWQPVKEKITTQAGMMLKHFKHSQKEEELSDSQGSFANSKSHGEGLTENKDDKDGKASREAMETVTVDNNFLLDSYSKSGEYCRLNQNMTYQKKS